MRRLTGVARAAARNRLYRSSFIIIVTQGLTSIIGYVFWAMAAHRSHAATVGLTGSLVSAVGAATLFSTTGITIGIIPVVSGALKAERPIDEIVGASAGTLALAVVSGGILTLILPELIPSLALAGRADIAPALFILTLSTSLGLLMDSVALAKGRSWIMLVRAFLASLVRLTVFALPGTLSVTGLIWAFALALALADVLAGVLLNLGRAQRLRLGAVRAGGRRVVYYLGHHLTSVGGAAAVYLLPVVVLVQLGPREAGYFYPTWLLAGMFFTISPAVSNAYLAGSHDDGGSIIGQLREPILLILGLLAIPMAICIADPGIVLRLLGTGYAQKSSGLMVVLAISAVPDAVTNVAVARLRLLGRLRTAALLNGSMSMLTLGLAVPLLASQGLAGAGEAWLIAQTVGACAVPLLLRGGAPEVHVLRTRLVAAQERTGGEAARSIS